MMMKNLYQLLFLLAISITAAFPQNISYAPLYDNTTFSGRTISTSLAVGSTPGAGSVSANGSASYNIPIATPPGTNNVVPGVSIDYNSAGNGGSVGMGWNISGLSAITRAARNVYFDGAAGAVDLSANDRFALDGARLIGKTGTYGATGSTYGTEVENFATVTALGSAGTGPLSFEMVGKDGVKMEFGNTADSRLMAQTGGTVLFWRLNKVIYPDGNYIEYVYTDTSIERDSRISEIRYTGNQAAGLSPYNKIEFAWKARQESAPGTFSDIRVTYEAGSSVVSKYLLDQVTVRAEGAIVRTYQFAYGHNNVNSFLKSVTEYGSDNSQLNATIFKYGDAPAEVTNVNTTVSSGINIQAMSGDFDGDGKHEILSAHVSTTSLEIPYYDSFKVFKANASGTDYSQVAYQPLPTNYTVVNKIDIPNSRSFIPSDFTGDGVDDVMTLKISYTGSYNKLDSVTIYESINGGTAFAQHRRSIQPNYFRLPGNNRFFFIGDFDGDGISEYLTILGNASGTIYEPFLCGNYLTSGACGSVSIPGGAGFATNTWVDASDIQTLDFNGDGKTDLLLVKNNACEIFTFNGTEATRIYAGAFPLSNKFLYIGDFNGDGKTDLIQAEPDFSQLTRALSTGAGFDQSPLTLVQPWPTNQPVVEQANKIIVGDYNGDGKSDLYYKWMRMMHYPNSTGYDIHTFTGTEIYYSQGTTFLHKTLSYNEDIQVGLGRPSTVTYIDDAPFDLNGDGRTDLVSSGGAILSYKLFNKDGKDNLLHKVSNGLNHVTEWSYKSLVEGGSFYSRGTGTSTYPLNSVQPAAILVSGIKVPNGIGGTSEITYSYEQARLHRAGKGFLGFDKVVVTDLVMGIKTVSQSQVNTNYYALVPYKESTFLTSTNTMVQETTNVGELLDLGGHRYRYQVNGTTVNKALEGRLVTASNTYDSYGNVTASTINNNVETVTTSSVYQAYATSIPNRPVSTTVTRTRSGQTAHEITTTYGYNGLGQMTTKTEFSGQSKSVITTYGYSNLGNLTLTKVVPSGMVERTVSSLFDPKGRYALTTTNEAGHSTSATYDARWGKVLTSTALNGLTTSFEYDAWGRSQKTTFSQGYATNQSLGWDFSNGAVYYSLAQHPGKPDVKIWYNVSGREIRKETEGMGGVWITEKKTYDAKGNVLTATQPFLPGEPEVNTTTAYDELNRPVSTTHPMLGTTTVSYSYSAGNLKVTTTAPGNRESSKTTDASGQTVSATDNGGTLTYTYYSHGGLKQVKRDNQTIASSEFDEYGRQTKLVDANSGTILYVHNALGQLTDETNANGHSYHIQYDPLGRILSRTGPEGSVTNEFFASGSGISQLKKSTGFAGNTTEYTYDNYGRVYTVTETIDGTGYTTTIGYNTYGDVTSKSYSDGFGTNHTYDGNGYAIAIKNSTNSLSFYTTGNLNGLCQVKSYSLGNGKSSQMSYESGLPTRYYTDGVQDLNMTWEYTTGDLLKRKDNIKNREEDFTYDALDRLSTAKVVGLATQTIAYESSGNIITKADAGLYSYLSTKPNAVYNVSNATGVIPSLLQTISYTPFMQPQVLSENGYELTYTYGEDYQRIKGVLKQNGTTIRTRYYLAGYERIGDRYIHYIDSPAGLVAMAVRENGSDTYYFTYTDHQGSILTITNVVGNVVAEQNFDAWGRQRNPATWDYTNLPVRPDWLYRGYTGHEHLDEFGLINMNGRLYDPVLGRMLSPDNFVQDPEFTQNYNRYSYALNNPLKYSDPNGQWLGVDDLIASAIGGIVNVVANIGNINSLGQAGSYFLSGAAGGLATIYAGPLVGAAVTALGNYATQNNWDFSQMSVKGAFFTTAISVASAGIGSQLNGVLSPQLSKIFGKISSPILRETLKTTIGGAAVGGILGGVYNVAETGNFDNFWSAFGSGAAQGAVAAAVTGAASTAHNSLRNGINPFTGEAMRKYAGALNPATFEPGEVIKLKRKLGLTSPYEEMVLEGRDMAYGNRSVSNYEITNRSIDEVWDFIIKDPSGYFVNGRSSTFENSSFRVSRYFNGAQQYHAISFSLPGNNQQPYLKIRWLTQNR